MQEDRDKRRRLAELPVVMLKNFHRGHYEEGLKFIIESFLKLDERLGDYSKDD